MNCQSSRNGSCYQPLPNRAIIFLPIESHKRRRREEGSKDMYFKAQQFFFQTAATTVKRPEIGSEEKKIVSFLEKALRVAAVGSASDERSGSCASSLIVCRIGSEMSRRERRADREELGHHTVGKIRDEHCSPHYGRTEDERQFQLNDDVDRIDCHQWIKTHRPTRQSISILYIDCFVYKQTEHKYIYFEEKKHMA